MRMFTRGFVWFGLAGLLLGNLACQKSKDLPLEAGFGGEQTVGTLHEVILTPTEIRQIRPKINFGLGPYLFVGKRHGLVTKSFFLFDALPGSSFVSLAELRFPRPYIYGEGEVRIRVYPVVTEWEEKRVTWTNKPEVDYSRTIGDTVWSSQDSLGIAVQLDTAVVNDWIWNPDGNRGFVIEAETGVDVLFEMYSIDAGDLDLAPYLWLKYTEKGKADSAKTFPSADVFAANWTDLPVETAYTLTSQDVDRILLKFDLSQIPSGATINRAQFEWSVVKEYTKFEDATLSVSLHYVTQWPWEGEYVSFDSTTNRVFLTLTQTSDLLTITALDQFEMLSHILQKILAGSLVDRGFLLKLAREDAAVGRVALVAAGTDSTTGPRLIVTYTMPPGGQ